MQNKLLKDLEDEFGSVNMLKNLALNADSKLFNFMLKDSKLKSEYKRRFFCRI